VPQARSVEFKAIMSQNENLRTSPSLSSPPLSVLIHVPVDVRSASIVTLAVLGAIYMLHWASPVFIPLMISLIMTYALSPVVSFLERRLKLSRWIAAGLLLISLAGGTGFAIYGLYGNAVALADTLPVAASKLRQTLQSKGPSSNKSSTLESVQKAAAQLEQATEQNASKVAVRSSITRVMVERPAFNIRDYLWNGTVSLVAAAGQLMLMGFLTFFTLGSGDMFRRKLVRLAGSSFEKKKITLHVLDDITSYIERYLLAQILTSALVGVATGLTFGFMGLDNAAVWGVIAAVTNLVPYLGSLAVMAAAGTAAFLQFGDIGSTSMVMGASLLIHTLVGNLLLPWLTGRSCRMNPVAVFVGVIFWGWLWGMWGLLLGIPIMMMIKAICEHVEDLQPFSELLSG
jgi:predicted PurR-regulated permease PerM